MRRARVDGWKNYGSRRVHNVLPSTQGEHTNQESSQFGLYANFSRSGGVLVFASGTDERIDAAAEIMNRQSPVEVEELTGGELDLSSTTGENVTPTQTRSVQTGRARQSGGGDHAMD